MREDYHLISVFGKTLSLKFLAVLCGFSLVLSPETQASPVTIQLANLQVLAADYSSGLSGSDYSTAFGNRTLAMNQGISSSSTTSNWVDTGSGALFDFDFEHTRAGNYSSQAKSTGSINFDVGGLDTTYDISGAYQANHAGIAGRVYFSVGLWDATVGSNVFKFWQWSDSTVDEAFTIGIAGGGDNYNESTGTATGSLLAGHSYTLQFNSFIELANFSGYADDDGANASGCVTLSIGGASGAGSCGSSVVSVPTPTSLLLLALGAFALSIKRRKA